MKQGTRTKGRNEGQSEFWALVAMLTFAVAFGGGGSKYGLANLIVILSALVAAAFHRRAFFEFWRSSPLLLRALVASSILLPIMFLIPLPQSVWSLLPGRDMVAQSYDLIGYEGWASASVNPVRTLLALTGLITPLAILFIGWAAPRDRLIVAGWVVVALGLANFAIGIPQVLSNSQTGVLYPENSMPGVLFGTFANRNSTGIFLVGTLALTALLPAPPRWERFSLPLRLGVCVLLLLAIILTRSRTAFVLALVPLGIAALRMLHVQFNQYSLARGQRLRRIFPVIIGVGLTITLIASILVIAPGRIGQTVERFSGDQGNPRAYIWEDARYSAKRFWPIGAGPGTFDDVFQIDESLENMTMRRAGRAHNDYLEVAIETGAPGMVVIIGWLVLLAWLSWLARTSHHRWIAWSGASILLVIALQSITDYPLRNQSLLAVGSFGLVMLARFSGALTGRQESKEAQP